uniref:DUF1749 domain-containing protein n=1 Tax=Chromera velia CCMP2878 TaxID=1169474 RepID=A0A0G4H3K5_9ALVE|eukprot:Cvel_24560.t1-p1 / transcript=Cvel_24560.t1 / gene=Cvel_24560 / organism=Chromera_velia_CCMP2878 / gene_product=hypothetical protein / transcript_product=hypothetical protein / location=Cvel_scaffold2670:18580-23898(+) / protein_length=361 / sequence_SO=supercontig / SO=protein_coding / is_pseudo=false
MLQTNRAGGVFLLTCLLTGPLLCQSFCFRGLISRPRRSSRPSVLSMSQGHEEEPLGLCMRGSLFHFDFRPFRKHLLGFVSNEECPNALVLVGGLTDGFLGLNYAAPLAESAKGCGFSLVQTNLSSSWNQFGVCTLRSDAQELLLLIRHLRRVRKVQKVVLLGHSTGSQDALSVLKLLHELKEVSGKGGAKAVKQLLGLPNEEQSDNFKVCIEDFGVNGVILQAGLSDREAMLGSEGAEKDGFLRLRDQADKLMKEGKPDELLPERLYGAVPITAYRFSSLIGRKTEDDLFSSDLEDDFLEEIVKPVDVPVFVCHGTADEYAPSQEKLREFTGRFLGVLKRKGISCDSLFVEGQVIRLGAHE